MSYITIIQRTSTTDDDRVYVAIHPELDCIAQGITAEEARRSLDEVRGMTIEHLTEHNIPIPEPRPLSSNFVFAWDCENLCEVQTQTR